MNPFCISCGSHDTAKIPTEEKYRKWGDNPNNRPGGYTMLMIEAISVILVGLRNGALCAAASLLIGTK